MRALKQRVRSWLVGHAPLAYWGYRHWRRGDEEPELALLPVLCKADKIAIDVGANFGMYSSRLVRHARQAVAFEPIPAFATMLRKGFGSRLQVHGVALSDVNGGEVELRLPHLYTGYATIETCNALATRQEDHIERVPVPRATLDSYELTDVGFVKIDVEGHEEAVVRGAEATLRRCGPSLLIEVEERHNEGSVDRLLEFLWGLDYRTFVVKAGEVHECPAFDLANDQRTRDPADYVRNLIGVPGPRAEDELTQMQAALAAVPN